MSIDSTVGTTLSNTSEILNCSVAAIEAANEAADHQMFIATLLLLVMITVAINLGHFLKHKKFTYLSETAIYILLGLFVSALWTSISYDPTNKTIQLNSHFFSLVLLPPIIFEGGYSVQRSKFFTNLLPILGLAMFGGFFSTFVIAILMYFFSRILTDNGWSFIESLVFGSLISSTDPVTVLSLLPSNVDKRLYILIFGESALNDAVSIILYRFFVGLQAEADNLSILPFFMSFLASCGVFIGSFAVGIFFALVFAKITKHVWIEGYEGAIYEMVMLVVCAYSSYLFAEITQLTGIISIFFCGIGISHWAMPNLTEMTKKTVRVTLRVVCLLFEGLIFLYFGLGLLSFGVIYDPLFILAAIIAIFAGRAHVFIVCYFNQFLPSTTPIPTNQQILMWFSGLRGAVAFALAVTFLDHPDFSPVIKGAIFGTTVMVILFTVLGLGGLTPYLLKWLKIIDESNELPTHDDHAKEPAEIDQTITERDLEQPVFGMLYRFDCKYVKPYFTHQTEEQAKVMEVIRRHDSMRSSRHNSMANLNRTSVIGRSSLLVMSPVNYAKLKNKENEEDQEKLINKTQKTTPEGGEEHLDSVNLN